MFFQKKERAKSLEQIEELGNTTIVDEATKGQVKGGQVLTCEWELVDIGWDEPEIIAVRHCWLT